MLYSAKMSGIRIEPDRVLDAIRSDLAANRETLARRYPTLPLPGYALPMAWHCAAEMSNDLVDAIGRYSSADHGSIFKALLAVVRGVLKMPGSEFPGPYFDRAIAHDQAVQVCLDDEYGQLSYFNLEVSLRNDYWRLFYDPDDDSFRLSLAPPQRRSALVLIDHKAESLGMTPELREIALSGSSSNAIPFSLAIGMREVRFLADAVPQAWNDLAVRVGFTLDEGTRFQAFIVALMSAGKLWFRADDLLETFTDFAKVQSLPPIAEQQFRRLADFFSLPPKPLRPGALPSPLSGLAIGWLIGHSSITFSHRASLSSRSLSGNMPTPGTTASARTWPRSPMLFEIGCRTHLACYSRLRRKS